jgi:hypothetical protein
MKYSEAMQTVFNRANFLSRFFSTSWNKLIRNWFIFHTVSFDSKEDSDLFPYYVIHFWQIITKEPGMSMKNDREEETDHRAGARRKNGLKPGQMFTRIQKITLYTVNLWYMKKPKSRLSKCPSSIILTFNKFMDSLRLILTIDSSIDIIRKINIKYIVSCSKLGAFGVVCNVHSNFTLPFCLHLWWITQRGNWRINIHDIWYWSIVLNLFEIFLYR